MGMLAALGVVVACMAFVRMWKTQKAMRWTASASAASARGRVKRFITLQVTIKTKLLAELEHQAPN